MSYCSDLIRYITASPAAPQAVKEQEEMLLKAGFTKLTEHEEWNLQLSGSYFVTRNASALIAFRIPKTLPESVRITATHADAPAFKIKNHPEIKTENTYVKLNVETYGGAILSTWFDRPLSIAGRVFVKEGKKAKEYLVDLAEDLCMIPSLAIHMDRDTNKGHAWDVQKELLPLVTVDKHFDLDKLIAKKLNIKAADLLSADLFLYNRQAPVLWGAKKEFLSAPRLDDASCAYASLRALISAKQVRSLAMHVMFDNEEVGSSSMQGAASTFLKDTLKKIVFSLHMEEGVYERLVSEGFLLSADNGHAVHPNYPEKCDPTNRPMPGSGILLKFAGNQKYTTDASSAAVVRLLAEEADVKIQTYHNHSDIPGGSTLGNLSVCQVAIRSADIGLAQLAMHSAYETCCAKDLEDLYRLLTAFYKK